MDSLGGFLALIVLNVNSATDNLSLMGFLNMVGDRMLYYAHLCRPNTIEGGWLAVCGVWSAVLLN